MGIALRLGSVVKNRASNRTQAATPLMLDHGVSKHLTLDGVCARLYVKTMATAEPVGMGTQKLLRKMKDHPRSVQL